MMTDVEKQYTDVYEGAREALFGHGSDVMNAVRDEACACFRRLGFPTRRVERYKYTDIAPLFAPDYGINVKRLCPAIDPYEAFRCDVFSLSSSLYFVINDVFYGQDRLRGRLPEGVIVCSLHEASVTMPALTARHYAVTADIRDDAVTALNTMFAQDGLFVYVPRGVKVDRPIQVINMLRADVDMMVNRRVLIVVEEDAEVKMLFCDHAADARPFLTTQVIEASVGERAVLDLYCMEETHTENTRVSNLYIRQQAHSSVYHNMITLHNGISRNRTDVVLDGEGALCSLCGCVTADKSQHVDNNTLIDHRAPGCTSHELYKYVLDDRAVGAFAGRVLVRKDAQHTVSDEVNRNICATREARMYTQPMLEIYADDVKCSHGSTVGQLNDAALFYMRQRGISLREARLMLQIAFVNEVIDRIRIEPLRDRLHYLTDKRFHGELSKCEGCRLCE